MTQRLRVDYAARQANIDTESPADKKRGFVDAARSADYSELEIGLMKADALNRNDVPKD